MIIAAVKTITIFCRRVFINHSFYCDESFMHTLLRIESSLHNIYMCYCWQLPITLTVEYASILRVGCIQIESSLVNRSLCTDYSSH